MTTKVFSLGSLFRDLSSGLVVALVALPLCLGIASASGAPLLAGLLAGVIGGIVVGILSGSHTSVAGPAAGLTAVVAAQIVSLGSFNAFLVAVVLAGLIQIAMGFLRAGALSLFFPSSVVKGLLAAIGIILILKEIPHLVGHDPDPEGEFSFIQPDKENTFSELLATVSDLHNGAALVGLSCFALLIFWDRSKRLKKSLIPAPSVIVALGIVATMLLRETNDPRWIIGGIHLVKVPTFESVSGFFQGLAFPDFSRFGEKQIFIAAITLAIVASLETLLNLEAVDKIDPKKRISPSNRELLAQGCGNVTSGLLGGLPLTSVIIRSSVNINAGARSKLSAIFHGFFLAGSLAFLPWLLNEIPRSALAAILVVTGIKLASWKIIQSVYRQGMAMFLPFIVTVIAIVLTDLLIGVLIGLAVSTAFILRSNLRKPMRRVLEKHVAGDVLHLQLANQVSFLNRASLSTVLEDVPAGSHVLIDASDTDYIDPDILDLIQTYEREDAPARSITVSLRGFHDAYQMQDKILYADFTTREVRDGLTPDRVLELLQEGHERFIKGQPIVRDLHRQRQATAGGQSPMAAVLGCIDSRTPVELIFDVGVGDIFTARVAGNVAKDTVLGSLEFACAVAGAKLILVMGHTSCGAITAAVDFTARNVTAMETTGCENLDSLIEQIAPAIDTAELHDYADWTPERKAVFADVSALSNVRHTINAIRAKSAKLAELEASGSIRIIGGIYDVHSGRITFEAV